MLEHVTDAVVKSDVEEVVIVLGFMAKKLAKTITPSKRIKVAVNKNYENGLASSIKAGLEALNRDSSAVVFVFVDQPFVKASAINSLVNAYKETGARIVIPTHKGRRGKPVLFDKSLFEEIKRISGDVGAREVVQRHEEEVKEIEVEDSSILLDIDTPEQLKLVRERT